MYDFETLFYNAEVTFYWLQSTTAGSKDWRLTNYSMWLD